MTNDPTKSDTYISCASVGDTLPDMSREIAEMGRGSMTNKILQIMQELREIEGKIEGVTRVLNIIANMAPSTDPTVALANEALEILGR